MNTEAHGNAADGTNVGLDVIVVGGGQAGLAIAWHLTQRGLRFLVLDAGPQVGHAWRSRWDSLKLFTRRSTTPCPAWTFPRQPTPIPTRIRSPTTSRPTPPGSSFRSGRTVASPNCAAPGSSSGPHRRPHLLR
jgi:cation diffusion facilitator CzcD-associated flavoprotein CzcO